MTNHAWRDNFVGISQGQTTIYRYVVDTIRANLPRFGVAMN